MPDLIAQPEQITTEWLTDVLRSAGVLPHGQVIAIERDISYPHGNIPFSTITCRLNPHYSPDAPSEVPEKLFLKIASPALMIGIPGLGKREVEFYNAVSSHMSHLPVIPCYEAVYDDAADRYHVLLDDLTDTHIALPPMQMPPLQSHCEMIIDALAQLHAFWWDSPRLGTEIGSFTDQEGIEEFSRDIQDTYPRFADFLEDRLSERRRSFYERALAGLPALMTARFRSREKMTIVFEDVHAGNFLYPRDPLRHSLKMIDWEQWNVNIATHDLAYMIGIFWFPERRSRLETSLLRRYHEQLVAYGVHGYSWDDLWTDYRLSIIRQLFVPMWQWSNNRPPDIWWNHLERITSAFDDLHCEELLNQV